MRIPAPSAACLASGLNTLYVSTTRLPGIADTGAIEAFCSTGCAGVGVLVGTVVWVLVGVLVCVGVGVSVGVLVSVGVGVSVGVLVSVGVSVSVGLAVGVSVSATT
jgi:hypothetical protein